MISEQPRGAVGTKAGAYILTVAVDGTPLLHGPYSTPRARSLVALQLRNESQGATLLLVDYSAGGMRVEPFDPATVSDLAFVNTDGVDPDPQAPPPRSLAARGQPR